MVGEGGEGVEREEVDGGEGARGKGRCGRKASRRSKTRGGRNTNEIFDPIPPVVLFVERYYSILVRRLSFILFYSILIPLCERVYKTHPTLSILHSTLFISP